MLFILFVLGVIGMVTVIIYVARKRVYTGDEAKDAATLAAYAHDISVFTQTPAVVYYPRTVQDIAYLAERTARLHQSDSSMSLTVRAGGTCMSGGSLSAGAILDLTRYMNQVVIDPVAQTAVVEMGAYFRDIEDAAALHGLMFAPYPSSRRLCGIGGMIGNNASGEKSIRFGATSDNVVALEVVLADGSVEQLASKAVNAVVGVRERALLTLAQAEGYKLASAVGKVKKAASGYRLDKVLVGQTFNPVPVFCGAQGTLGIVTKATLKLVPIPAHVSLIMITAQQLEAIPAIVEEIFKWNPEAIETFDSHTFTKAREHLASAAIPLMPYLDSEGTLFILAEFSEKTLEATEAMAAGCAAALEQGGYFVRTITDPLAIAAAWDVRRNSFLLMRDHNPAGFKAVPCIEDVIVPTPALAEFIAGLGEILQRRGIQYGFHGHIGDGSLRVVPIFDVRQPTVMDEITGLMQEVFALIKHLDGNISADHSDGIIRSPFLRDFYGDELIQVFEEIKHIYDPVGIMNPGKKIGATMDSLNRLFDSADVRG